MKDELSVDLYIRNPVSLVDELVQLRVMETALTEVKVRLPKVPFGKAAFPEKLFRIKPKQKVINIHLFIIVGILKAKFILPFKPTHQLIFRMYDSIF